MLEYPHSLVSIQDYERFIGAEAVERIYAKAEPLEGIRTVNVNSTYYGGGVAEILNSRVLLMNGLGIEEGWRIIHGTPDFFSITKKMHNALQGAEINLTDRKRHIYEDVIFENAIRNHLDHDFVIIHDPQPLPMIKHYRKYGPWVWRCHIDLTRPNRELWDYLLPIIEKYDGVVFSIKEYAQKLRTPSVFIMPAIDPFSIKNKELDAEEVKERLDHYGIPTDLPLVAQVSRFDLWKDPMGVIEAFRLARKEVECTLVMVGNPATDDPEGAQVYESLLGCQEERIKILSVQDSALVNAVQRAAYVVVQKSLREGFGLTVAEAMWKGTPVIGGNVGGIRHQIRDGVNGFLVSSVTETAQRLVQLLKDKKLREEMGRKARETVKENFLMSRYVEQNLDLYNSFETIYRMHPAPGLA